MSRPIAVILLIVVVAVVVFASSRLLRLAARRGWVYNKHNPRPRGAGIPGPFDEMFQPGIAHVIEEMSAEVIRADQAESGDKPDPGSRHGDT